MMPDDDEDWELDFEKIDLDKLTQGQSNEHILNTLKEDIKFPQEQMIVQVEQYYDQLKRKTSLPDAMIEKLTLQYHLAILQLNFMHTMFGDDDDESDIIGFE